VTQGHHLGSRQVVSYDVKHAVSLQPHNPTPVCVTQRNETLSPHKSLHREGGGSKPEPPSVPQPGKDKLTVVCPVRDL
jgi:hypothetical protein